MKNNKKVKQNTLILLVVVIVLGLGYKILYGPEQSSIMIQTVSLEQEDIITSITATGTIEPVDQVEVGTQVSGIINHIYVDYNSEVSKGQLIAELDKTNLQESVNNAQAQYNAAENELRYYRQNYERQHNMFQAGVISKADYESAEYQMNNAKQLLNQRETALAQAKTNLSYANIYAPIDGIVLSREVEEGQTVAASMTTPTLFTIAKDIKKMQVEADVDEADIGGVKVGQRVSFTVDAYPEQTFNGKVIQVRLSPTTESNVVTYTVIISADNPEEKLKPGLTATVSIYTHELKSVATLPVTAINFAPSLDLIKAYYSQNLNGQQLPKILTKSFDKTYVWVKNNDGSLVQKSISTGITDRVNMVVKSGLSAEDDVVIALEKSTSADEQSASEGSSPFMPKPPDHKNEKGKAPQ